MLPTRVCPVEERESYLEVSLFPSQHCPGSVVFIFEGSFGKYVYTGDIRLELGPNPDFPFYSVDFDLTSEDSIIPWSKMEGATRLFMDTTFVDTLWETLPHRLDAISEVIKLIESLSKETRVLLECEMLGTEQVLIGVSEHFGIPFYAERKLYLKLEAVPGLKKHLTREKEVANRRFMVVPHGAFSRGNLDRTHTAKNVARSVWAMSTDTCFIKPSTQWFGAKTVGKIVDARPVLHAGVWHVLYSIHNSFSEVRHFVSRIRPQAVSPLVSCQKTAFREVEALCCVAPSADAITLPNRSKDPLAPNSALIETDSRCNRHSLSGKDLLVVNDSVLDDSINLSLYEIMQTEENGVKGEEQATKLNTVNPALWKGPSSGKAKSLFDESFSEDLELENDDENTPEMTETEVTLVHKRRDAPDLGPSLFELVEAGSPFPICPPSKKRLETIEDETKSSIVTFSLVYDVDKEET